MKSIKKTSNIKLYCIVLSLLLFISILSCKENSVNTNPNVVLSAIKDGSENWISKDAKGTIWNKSKVIWIVGNKFGAETYLSMQLNFTSLSDLKSIYIKQVDYYYLLGGDVVIDQYSIDTTDTSNNIQFSQIDTLRKRITGTFNFKLIRTKWFSTKGEVTEFKSGKFEMDYNETQY